MALNKLHELGLPNSALLSLTWVTWLAIMILPYFFVALAKALFYLSSKYASELFSRVGLTDSKTVDIPVELNAHLTLTGGKSLSNPSFYRRLVGSLVYLIVTRPDISNAVHQVSQYMSTPRLTHYATVLCILRYLKGTIFHGFFYSAQSPLVLHAFSVAD
ncbi:uncharacterized mitochondrial protein AtMg00810-like [Quercus robur]|uniref:uncharacterized mitochondrial protein AtMg00810-like n=1 Tax=Quercus robur TaxID=38942 RepID=UPI00216334AA|nr:uncharacterized mitochondrial protein AtMg00810-like [Quercus robur]